MAPRKMTSEQMAAENVLRDMFVKGNLTGEEKSADVRKENISTFRCFDTPKFLKLFTELKREFGLPKRGNVSSQTIHRASQTTLETNELQFNFFAIRTAI